MSCNLLFKNMIRVTIFNSLLLLFFFHGSSSIALKPADIHKIRKEKIVIQGIDKGYTSEITLQSVVKKNHPVFFIDYSSFENVHNIKVTYFNKKKGKFKKFRKTYITDFQMPSTAFYSSYRTDRKSV